MLNNFQHRSDPAQLPSASLLPILCSDTNQSGARTLPPRGMQSALNHGDICMLFFSLHQACYLRKPASAKRDSPIIWQLGPFPGKWGLNPLGDQERGPTSWAIALASSPSDKGRSHSQGVLCFMSNSICPQSVRVPSNLDLSMMEVHNFKACVGFLSFHRILES